jgi:hypothetical protein
LNKTLISIFSIVALPLGLVVAVSADPSDNHTVSYTVEAERAISVETRSGTGTTAIDFGTVSTDTAEALTNEHLRLKFTAQKADAASTSAVKIRAELGVAMPSGVFLEVTPGDISDEDVSANLSTGFELDDSGNQFLITQAYKEASGEVPGGFTDVTSDLKYTFGTNGAAPVESETVTVTYTLLGQ